MNNENLPLKRSGLFLCQKSRLCLLFSGLFFLGIAFSGIASTLNPALKVNTSGFQKNVGQYLDQHNQQNSNVLYGLSITGMNIGLVKNGFSYTTYTLSEVNEYKTSSPSLNRKEQHSHKIKTHRIDVVFEGHNPNCKVISSGSLGNPVRYIKGGTNALAQSYQKVNYTNLYPNIDLEFIAYSTENKPVEYNFIVRPGGKLSDIKMRYSGAQSAKLINGKLVLELAHGTLTESIPASWLQENNKKQDIVYQVLSQEGGSILIQLRNKTENKGLKQTLIVDPVPTLDWATYFGGFDYESVNHSVLDAKGNVYITGESYSNSNIHTAGAHQDTINGYTDAYVAKFNKNGGIIWSTYFGGHDLEEGFAGYVDHNGFYYLVGETESDTFFATPGAHQVVFGKGYQDGFLAKFDSTGDLVWNTYYGGDGGDEIFGIHGDSKGSIYIVGKTHSVNNMHTSGAQDTTIGSIERGDGFVAKFNTDGVRQWGTYIGGENIDGVNSCHTDSEGNLICCLVTQSATGIATSGTHQESHGGGGYDAAVAKYNSSGTLLWSTYYGGNWTDDGYGCAVDKENNIIISGITRSITDIATEGAHQSSFNGGQSGFQTAFIAKFNSNGVRQWGTYAGNGSAERMHRQGSIDVDAMGNIYLGAYASFTDTLLHSMDGYNTNAELGDALLMKFNPNGQRRWGTYFGGIGADEGTSVNVDFEGNIVIVGESVDSSIAARFSTPGVYQTKNNGYDIFIARLTQVDYISVELDTVACDSIKLMGQWYTSSQRDTLYRSDSLCCDTIHVLNVTIHNSSNSMLNETACDVFLLNGFAYAQTGTYQQMLTNHQGCDSNLTLNLIVNSSSQSMITTAACGSYELNGKFYTQTGTYQQVIPNASGCDSIITLNLSITPTGIDADFVVASQLITHHEVSMVNITQQIPDSVQWIIPNLSAFTIKSQTPNELRLEFMDSGTYEFGLRTFMGSCSNYSSKTLRVLESQGFGPVVGQGPFINHFNIFPNPSTNQFTAEIVLSAKSEIRLRIVDPITNQVLDDQLKTEAAEYSVPYSLALQPGVYIMLLETANGNLIARFVIQ